MPGKNSNILHSTGLNASPRWADDISEAAVERLVKQGIFESDAGGFWTLSKKVSRSGRYPLVDGRAGEEIKGRIMRTLLDNEIPDPRDIVIIGLVNNCGGFRAMLEPEEYELAEERIELFSGMDLIGRTIGAAVRSSYLPPESMRAVTRRRMPMIRTLGPAFLENIPLREPAQVHRAKDQGVGTGFSNQSARTQDGGARQRRVEPVGRQERP